MRTRVNLSTMLRQERIPLVVINAGLIGELPGSPLLCRRQRVPMRRAPDPIQRQVLLTPHENRPHARVQFLNGERRPIYGSGGSECGELECGSIQRLAQLGQRGSPDSQRIEPDESESCNDLRVSLIDEHDQQVLRPHKLVQRRRVLLRARLNLTAQVTARRTAAA